MKKKILSLALTICMVATILPMTAKDASAAVKESTGVKNRLVQVVNETNNKLKTKNIFSVDGTDCYVRGVDHECSNCDLYSILDYFGESRLKSNTSDGYQCAAFAKYVFVKTFGTTKNTNDSTPGYGNKESTFKSFRTGDLFFTDNHWMIFLSCDSSGVNVLDCNGDADMRIRYTKYSYSNPNMQGLVTVWQSPSSTWNDVNKKYGTSNTVSAASVSLNASKKTLGAGSIYYLKATVAPSNTTNKTVTWSSSNKSVATVNSSGMVTALKKGTTTITAKTPNGKKKSCTITVKSPSASMSTLRLSSYTSGPSSNILKGTSVYIKGTANSNFKIAAVTISIKNAKGKTVQKGTYKPNAYSADISKADVGYIYFSKLPAGKYTMYITAKDKVKTTTLKKTAFTVSDINLYSYKGPSSTVKKGTSIYLKGTVKSYYTINKINIAIYNSKGKVIQKGSYSPYAKVADVSKADVGYIYFSKLAKGKYKMKITASTTNKTYTLKNVNFTIK